MRIPMRGKGKIGSMDNCVHSAVTLELRLPSATTCVWVSAGEGAMGMSIGWRKGGRSSFRVGHSRRMNASAMTAPSSAAHAVSNAHHD